MLAPFTAGSTVDVMARVVQEQLSNRLGQNIVVDNRPGANGIIATEMVAKSRPDGYTMLISTGSFTGNVIATKKLPYDTVRDFAQITQIARSYGLLRSLRGQLGDDLLRELPELLRQHRIFGVGARLRHVAVCEVLT